MTRASSQSSGDCPFTASSAGFILRPIVALTSLLCAALGGAFGSFAGLCLDRIPRRESITRPPSHCRACHRGLAAADLVPVLSYLQRRGRCRYCGAAIDPRLLVLELVAALGFAALPVWLGTGAGLTAALGLVAAGVALAAAAAWGAARLPAGRGRGSPGANPGPATDRADRPTSR